MLGALLVNSRDFKVYDKAKAKRVKRGKARLTFALILPVDEELELVALALLVGLLHEADVLPDVDAGRPVEDQAGQLVGESAHRVFEVDLTFCLVQT